MSTITKEQLIEDLKASTQNSSGMFEIGEETICALMSLLTATPAPVSVPDDEQGKPHPVMAVKGELGFVDNFDRIISERDEDIDIGQLGSGNYEALILAALDAFRAAMLQSAEPVTTAYKLPDEFDFDRFNDVVWLETVASNPHMHSPTTSTIAMVALELNKRLEAGNSPVIPDGWVMVPVEPTAEMQSAAAGVIRFDTTPMNKLWTGNAVYRAMIAAAPQHEITKALAKGMERYGNAMQELAKREMK